MLLELSYVFGAEAPKWPTNPTDSFVLDAAISRGNPNNASTITHHMHNGSHVDAPAHFVADGRHIDEIPIEDFYYTNPLVLYIPKKKGERITLSDLLPHDSRIKECDILLFYSGYADLRSEDPAAFINDFPCIREDAARYLRKECPKLKAIAMDFLSVDSSVTGVEEGFPAHHALLDKDQENPERTLLIFEDINTKKLYLADKPAKAIYAFPPRFSGLEAAPVSMVAEL